MTIRQSSKPRALLSWSSGKDSAWALHRLRQKNEVDVVGLVTTFNQAFARVAMHGVRRELVEQQARSTGLPLWPVLLPWPCSNQDYEKFMIDLLEKARKDEIRYFAFGDLFLEDIRAYRETMLAGSGIKPLFPLWTSPGETASLAREMIEAGVCALLTCVDPRHLDASFVGRSFDTQLLNDFRSGTDRCGERGEFHTFCHQGPMFARPIACHLGERVERDGFHFVDVLPDGENVKRIHPFFKQETGS
jgi:uncharacterized protein (TIGR00290 family)